MSANEEREVLILKVRARKAIYEKKRDRADGLAEDSLNEHEKLVHTVEAFDHLLADLGEPKEAITVGSDTQHFAGEGHLQRGLDRLFFFGDSFTAGSYGVGSTGQILDNLSPEDLARIDAEAPEPVNPIVIDDDPQITALALALRDECEKFDSPVDSYVCGEFERRWREANPGKDMEDAENYYEIDFALESWKILARAAANLLPQTGVDNADPPTWPASLNRMKIAARDIAGQSGSGALHIFVEDGNCTDEDIAFCMNLQSITDAEREFCERMLSMQENERCGAWAIAQEMPDGFIPWYGGDEAPKDWDGRRPLMRNGGICSYPFRWKHTGDGDDIVGYNGAYPWEPKS